MPVYGPYLDKANGRMIIIVDGKTISYAKYIYEQHHKVDICDGWEVDHIDDDFTNNDISNLQLLTKAENVRKQHANFISGGWKQSEQQKRSGAKNGMAKLTDKQVAEIRALCIPGRAMTLWVAEKYGVSRLTIENIRKRRTYK